MPLKMLTPAENVIELVGAAVKCFGEAPEKVEGKAAAARAAFVDLGPRDRGRVLADDMIARAFFIGSYTMPGKSLLKLMDDRK